MLRNHSGQEGLDAGIMIFLDLIPGSFLSTGVSGGGGIELLEYL